MPLSEKVRALGQAAERADDAIDAIVVDDREAVAHRRREAERDGERAAAQIHAAGRLDLVVARAGRRAVQLDREGRSGEIVDVAGVENARGCRPD